MVKSTQNSISDIHQTCHTHCEKISSETDKSMCKIKCDTFFQLPAHCSQISEKFKASVSNILNESEELLHMADKICALEDMMYF
ncbi:MAG: hypothetical protein ACR5LA_04005 [Wolbachia sp.]